MLTPTLKLKKKILEKYKQDLENLLISIKYLIIKRINTNFFVL